MSRMIYRMQTDRRRRRLGNRRLAIRWSGRVSRILSWAIIYLGRSSPTGSCTLPAAYEQKRRKAETPKPGSPCDIRHPTRRAASRCLFGLAGGGVYPAAVVTNRAVRSYRTISPLPKKRRKAETSKRRNNNISVFQRFLISAFRGRCLFCGTFPRLAPGWRYQPPCPAQFGLSSRKKTPAVKPPVAHFRAIAFAHSNGSTGL